MKHCPYCGNQLDDNAKFCNSCGNAQPQPQYTQPQHTQPQYEQPQYAQPQQQVYANYNAAPAKQSYWDGGVFDTILNSIAASLIITFTCGIATPWAICYIMRFVVEHAVIDGKRLSFDGTGGQLFGNWIKWFFLSIVTCGIYGFWVTPRLYQWVCSHIHTK